MLIDSGIARCLSVVAAGCTAAIALHAFAAEPQLDELAEVVVTAKVPVTLDSFVEWPRYDMVAISPGGTHLATGWTENSFQRLLTVSEFPSMKRVDNQLLQANMGGIADMRWASERHLIMQPDYPRLGFPRIRDPMGSLYIADTQAHTLEVLNTDPLRSGDPLGDQRREEAAAARSRASSRRNTPPASRDVDRGARGPLRIISARIGQPDQSLFQTTRSDRGGTTDGYGAFMLNLEDKAQSRVATLPVAGGQFVTGPDHQVALVSGVNEQNERVVYYLPPESRAEGNSWQLVVRSPGGARGLRPIAWSGNGEEYYALDGRGNSTRAVVMWNAATNTQRVLYRHPAADLDNYALDPAGKPWMFSGTDHVPVYWYPDPQHPLAALHRSLVRQLPREQIDITSADDALGIAVVRVGSARRAPIFLVIDIKTGASRTAFHTYPKLRGTRLSPVDPIEFLARDGLVIHGYLTTPTTADDKPRTGLPLVVIANDGPQGEASDFRYEVERQLFASRGYAVLQVNHRGSPGRGAEFERAGDGKWGREVQDDYIDAVRWAIRDGVAAADRVCFYGTRYGGYSALMAAALAPDMFKCVISISGVHDLPAMLGDGKEPVALPLQQVLGTDMAELKARSPTARASAIKAKVLLMQQQNDDVVPLEQFTRMRVALAAAGNKPQQETIGQQYNGIFSPENRAAVYERVLRFLGQNIGK